jgi:hypothetical protein
MNIPRIENMQSARGNNIPNQFRIYTDEGVFFQSYSTIIVFKPYSGKIKLDQDKWDFSVTTGKCRNLFLHETKKETEHKIKAGVYELVDLNK